MRRTAIPVLLFWLGAAATPSGVLADSTPRVAIAGGAGVAFGTLGAHLEVGTGHVAAFVGLGVDAFSLSPARSLSAGVRFFSADRDGLLLSLAFTTASDHRSGALSEYEDLDDRYLTATLGWRLRHRSGFFAEAGAGGGVMWRLDRGFILGPAVGQWKRTLIPDVDLALGFQF